MLERAIDLFHAKLMGQIRPQTEYDIVPGSAPTILNSAVTVGQLRSMSKITEAQADDLHNNFQKRTTHLWIIDNMFMQHAIKSSST